MAIVLRETFRRMRPLLLACGLLLVAASPAWAEGAYTVTPITAPGATVSLLRAINESGEIVGEATLPGEREEDCGFVWRAGTSTLLAPSFTGAEENLEGCAGAGSGTTFASAIGNTGLIVGWAIYQWKNGIPPEPKRAYPTYEQAVTWTGSAGPVGLGHDCTVSEPETDLDGLPGDSRADAISPSGTIVGEAQEVCTNLAGGSGAWLGAPNKVIVPEPSEYHDSIATAVNSSEQVVIVREGGELPTELYPGLGVLAANPYFTQGGAPGTINDAGTIVGLDEATNQAAYSVGVNVPVDLTPADGDPYGLASGVNERGDIVGESASKTGATVATLWPNAAPPTFHEGSAEPTGTDLNLLLPAEAEVHLTSADAINAQGEILATGLSKAKEKVWVMLTPKPGISGTVTNGDGTPVVGAEVDLTGKVLGSGAPVSEQTSTEADGGYSFAPLEPGEYTVGPVQPADPAEGRYLETSCSGTAQPGACQINLAEVVHGTASFRRDTLIVNSTQTGVNAEEASQGICDITPSGANQTCTLPQAIDVANELGTAKLGDEHATIAFNIPSEGLPRIVDPGGLPQVTAPTTIDGSSQPGGEGVELSGGWQTGSPTNGILIAAGGAGSRIMGLLINGYSDQINLVGGNDTIQANRLDTNITGEIELPNPLSSTPMLGTQSHIGVRLASSGNQIGGPAPGQGNLIATGWTINAGAVGAIDDVGGSQSQNVIQGNWIGLKQGSTAELLSIMPSGLTPTPQEEPALLLTGAETVGGSAPGDGNLITPGAIIAGPSVVQGNTIIGSLTVEAKATIGGATSTPGAGAGNDFSDPDPNPGLRLIDVAPAVSPAAGVQLPVGAVTEFSAPGGTGAVIQGNRFHNDPEGAIAIQATNVTVGGAQPDLGNIIEGTATRQTTLQAAGVMIDTTHQNGKARVENNTIDRNGDDGGVVVYEGDGDTITANEMVANTAGIAFGNEGFIPNGVKTPDAQAPNDYEYYPVLDDSQKHSGIELTGHLVQPPTVHSGVTFTVDLYSQASCSQDSVDAGQGEHFLGSKQVLNVIGNKEFKLTFPSASGGQDAITATSTAPDGSTSEFSPCLTIGHKGRSFTLLGVTPTSSTVAITTGSAAASVAVAKAKGKGKGKKGTGKKGKGKGNKHTSGKPGVGHGVLQILCPPVTTGSCSGKVTIRTIGHGASTLARKSFKLRPGFVAPIAITVPAAVLSRLKKAHHLSVRLAIAARDGAKHAHHKHTTAKLTLTYTPPAG